MNSYDEDDRLDSLIGQKYDDFHTIDWQRDLARDRLRHKYVVKRKDVGVQGWIASMWDATSGWACVLLVGITAGTCHIMYSINCNPLGTVAGVIDIGAKWMSDLKVGVCADRFWLDKEHCCWASDDEVYARSGCPNVRTIL
jgi:chloride channel 3/4/5